MDVSGSFGANPIKFIRTWTQGLVSTAQRIEYLLLELAPLGSIPTVSNFFVRGNFDTAVVN